jgi:hypothetical protein
MTVLTLRKTAPKKKTTPALNQAQKPGKLSTTILLTSDSPHKEAVLGVFDLAEIVARGSKNKQIDGFCAKFFAKSIAKNRNRLAFVAEIWNFFRFLCSSFLVNCCT